MSIPKSLILKTTLILILPVIDIRNIKFCSGEVCGIRNNHKFSNAILACATL